MTSMRFASITFLFVSLIPFLTGAQQQTKEQAEDKDFGEMLRAFLRQEEILNSDKTHQEYVEVSRERYPGLDLKLVTPAELASGYRPPKTGQLFTETDLMMLHRIFDYDITGTARPYRSGRLFSVPLPTD